RGLTTATGSPAACTSLAAKTSKPPVASSTTTRGLSVRRRAANEATAVASLATRKLAGPGQITTSNHSCDTSMPTHTASIHLLLRGASPILAHDAGTTGPGDCSGYLTPGSAARRTLLSAGLPRP